MAVSAFPRSKVKKIVKAHSGLKLGRNVETLMYLDYVLFMQTLLKEAAIESRRTGDRVITARSVHRTAPVTLAKFKG